MDGHQDEWIGARAVGRRLAVGLAGLLLSASAARADINITPAVAVFDSKATDNTIIVTNDGKDLTFVTARVRAVDAPGEKDENLRFEPNPGVVGLLATPNRMVLEPGERRAIRLLAMKAPSDADRVWRVHIAPSIGKLKEGQSGVAFEIAYDALIIQRAAKAKPSITGRRSGKQLTLTNSGNSFAMISAIEQCPGGACKKLPGIRLYAGKTWTTELPDAESAVTITVDGVGARKETLRY
jgi:P pilus assembly chaperone PapD